MTFWNVTREGVMDLSLLHECTGANITEVHQGVLLGTLQFKTLDLFCVFLHLKKKKDLLQNAQFKEQMNEFSWQHLKLNICARVREYSHAHAGARSKAVHFTGLTCFDLYTANHLQRGRERKWVGESGRRKIYREIKEQNKRMRGLEGVPACGRLVRAWREREREDERRTIGDWFRGWVSREKGWRKEEWEHT